MHNGRCTRVRQTGSATQPRGPEVLARPTIFSVRNLFSISEVLALSTFTYYQQPLNVLNVRVFNFAKRTFRRPYWLTWNIRMIHEYVVLSGSVEFSQYMKISFPGWLAGWLGQCTCNWPARSQKMSPRNPYV